MIRLAWIGNRLRHLLGRSAGGRVGPVGAIQARALGADAGGGVHPGPGDAIGRTTTPVPQPHDWFDILHGQQMAALATIGDVDVLLIGDSLAQHWPLKLWSPWRAFSLGVGGDGTQHVLWRLERCDWANCRPARILLMVGTNNLLNGDGPADIVAGIEAILAAIAQAHPTVVPFVLMTPPLGPGLRDYAEHRRILRILLSARFGHRLIDADAALIADGREPNPNYADDHIHFSHHGYEVLTDTVRVALR